MAVTDMFKNTINNFADDVKSTKQSIGNAVKSTKPTGAKVLATLKSASASKPVGMAKAGLGGLVDNINTIPSTFAAGDDIGMALASDASIPMKVGGVLEALGNTASGALMDRFSAGKKSALTKGGVAIGNTALDYRPATKLGSVFGETPLMQMRKMLEQQSMAANAPPTKIVEKEVKDAPVADGDEVEKPEVANSPAPSGNTDRIGLSAPSYDDAQPQPQPQQAASPLQAIRDTLAQAQNERSKVVNPLQQESTMQLKDYSDNPIAAAMQLQQAVGQLVPFAVNNKIARQRAKDLSDDAKNEAGLIELENTLKNADLNRLKTNADIEKSGLETEEAKITLEQKQRLNDAMIKLGTLTDDDERRALQDSILTMLGKEPRDNYVIQEVGGGTDPTGNFPLPKRAVVFDKSTGKVIADIGDAQMGQNKPSESKYKVGAQYNIGGKVVKVTGMDKEGKPIFDDDI